MNNRNQEQNRPAKKPQFDDFISPEPFSEQGISKPQGISKRRANESHPLMPSMDYPSSPRLTPEQEQALVRYNHLSYVLYLLSFFTAGLTWIIPIFMNYYKRREAEGTWLATHFDWQIKTFWYSFIMGVVAIFCLFFAMGGLGISVVANSGNMAVGSSLLFVLAGFIFLVAIIWHLYRIVRGWIALTDARPVP